MIHKTCNHVIDEHALSLQNAEGVKLNIRPKTCQLLLYLVKHEGQAIDKQTLLETVWAETVVTEQVVFQSINEIRQLFREQDVIKTIPKQRYIWLPEVVAQPPSNDEDGVADRAGQSSGSRPISVKALYALGLMFIAILTARFLMPTHTAADK